MSFLNYFVLLRKFYEMSRYTITAALPYTNGPVHIGHLAGVYVPADIYARFQRLKGNDVAFICGSDEHGVAISIKAQKEGITPQSEILLKILEFLLIIIQEHQGLFIIKQLQISLKNFMKIMIL